MYSDRTYAEKVFTQVQLEQDDVVSAEFRACRFVRCGFSDSVLRACVFEECVIDHSTFLGLDLKGISFVDCTAKDVDFREADLSNADFSGSDLTGAQFGGTNLTGANLERARNYSIDPGRNVLKGARFSLPEVMSLLSGLDIEISGWD